MKPKQTIAEINKEILRLEIKKTGAKVNDRISYLKSLKKELQRKTRYVALGEL
jgi:hypothetical protein